MKTKVEVVVASSGPDTFKKELQQAIDAIELNINNTIIDIKYGFNNGFSAIIVYKERDKQMLNEALSEVVSIEE